MGRWWIGDLYQAGEIVILVSWIFWVIFSITLHELAHGWTAVWQGDNTPRALGRLTLNPYVHMGPISLIAFLVIGFAWGMMPVNPDRFRWGRWGDVLVSAAGPAMNLALAFIALTAAALWNTYSSFDDSLHGNVLKFLTTGGWLNLFLAAFNLLPVPPFDGSKILAGVSRGARRLYEHPNAEMAGLAFLMIVFMTGILGFLIGPVRHFAVWYVETLQGVLP